jgi:hypothetical protein
MRIDRDHLQQTIERKEFDMTISRRGLAGLAGAVAAAVCAAGAPAATAGESSTQASCTFATPCYSGPYSSAFDCVASQSNFARYYKIKNSCADFGYTYFTYYRPA